MTSDVKMSPPVMGGDPISQPPTGKRSSWPTVLGVIGIVWASLGILRSIASFFTTIIVESLAAQLEPEEQAEIMESLSSQGAQLFVEPIVNLVLCIVLLWGAIQLLKRRQSARGVLNSYAVVTIVWYVIFLVWNVILAESHYADVADRNSLPVDDMFADPSIYFTLACNGVMILPEVVLIFVFMNGGRFRKEMETWID